MRVALLGGTGNLGKGLALRLATLGHEIVVGSRKEEKAEAKAAEYRRIAGDASITGMKNEDAAEACDIAVLTIPWEHAIDTARDLKNILREKIVVSPLVPVSRGAKGFTYSSERSAAEIVAEVLESEKVVSALHTIPAARFANLDEKFDWDVPVCGDDDESKKVVMSLISEIDGLRPLDAGPLSNSRLVESLTPLILNIMRFNGMGELGIKFL
ncbi:NADPH-dependent F420 reductase [Archaeoglobus fulgidus]|jgi:hypothetical protein|uniref:NADPH-dependent F420 reductase n=2 Tax=Archaeoglobus fulgidus TaxID=2234 RepID=A0A075WDK2_ARCFL|nr:NADPH-dependent F420 reductase [Archaeoglobus fulgidus]AIG97767.1 NADPH-dependent F420 reductase [Archaeoglobus fulgidus DSM 8774]KUJ93205.1 MAG: 8-hydroxy-5-deazaflavin:NADPH oxidoreductase [Archaeoglobus fulgidus]KUK05459.1 MAG: 8-hydroxy-5-deazaflavin:NADPH oxidoreductase [Archaeoglobus fulgidus]